MIPALSSFPPCPCLLISQFGAELNFPSLRLRVHSLGSGPFFCPSLMLFPVSLSPSNPPVLLL